MSKKSSNSIITNLINEARSYSDITDIEALTQSGNLDQVPMQPLYLCVRQMEAGQLVEYLSKFSKQQRQTFLDIDLWNRDQVDVNDFASWLTIYSAQKDIKLKFEFARSDHFALFLKSRLNLWTFDVEDPMYPDHDYYFITDDNQLLIEYDEDFTQVDELKSVISILYSEMGVEKAYSHLFKIISDGFLTFHEDEYRHKKERLRDFGFIDYFEALELTHPFAVLSQVDSFIAKKSPVTALVDSLHVNQVLHEQTLVAYEKDFEDIHVELNKITDEKRRDFVHFNFLRLVNATLSAEDALKKSTLTMTNVGKQAKNFVNLGLSYVRQTRQDLENTAIFDYFDFVDLHKIGKSLVFIKRKEIKKSLMNYSFETTESEAFLGQHFNSIIELSFNNPAQFYVDNKKAIFVNSFEVWSRWSSSIDLLIKMLPFAATLRASYLEMRDSGLVRDDYYLNYDVASIDFEAIIISSLINFILGHYTESSSPKMGVDIRELKTFVAKIVDENNSYIGHQISGFNKQIKDFCQFCQLTNVSDVKSYLHLILDEHLSGYDYSTLSEDEFSHVGGPIILNIKGH